MGPVILQVSEKSFRVYWPGSLPHRVDEVTLYNIDILVFGESIHFEPGKLLQSIPEDWIGRPSSHTTYCISSMTVYRVCVE